MNEKQVTIYTTPTCHYCKAVKEFFNNHGVKYTEFDVQADAVKRQEMIEKSGQMGVPVIYIGEEMVIGFDEERLTQLLGL